MIEANLLHQINFEDLIKDTLLIRNVGENSLKCNIIFIFLNIANTGSG
jgi:hypothetical protein